jgi:hypothetical protein
LLQEQQVVAQQDNTLSKEKSVKNVTGVLVQHQMDALNVMLQNAQNALLDFNWQKKTQEIVTRKI